MLRAAVARVEARASIPPVAGSSRPNVPALKTIPLDTNSDLRERLVASLKAPFRPALVVQLGKEIGLTRSIDQTVTIGRDPAVEVVLTDAGVSWQHARIEDRGDSWAVVDLGSTNGTFVNNERVTDRILSPGDRIVFGPVVTRFEVQDGLQQQVDQFVEKMINIDELSGLLMRRKFDTELAMMVTSAATSGGTVGLLVMDLDGVKGINDTHGHLFGAYVIGEAGHLIGEILQPIGQGTRFGGDEYCAALPDYDLQATVAVGETILKAINAHHFEREGIVLKPGISVGAASYPACAQAPESLFQRADEAMYRAKRGGKNRVCT